jgi:hypothetical protein
LGNATVALENAIAGLVNATKALIASGSTTTFAAADGSESVILVIG